MSRRISPLLKLSPADRKVSSYIDIINGIMAASGLPPIPIPMPPMSDALIFINWA